MANVRLVSSQGEPLHTLPITAEELLMKAEEHARLHRLVKRTYFPVAVRAAIEEAGFLVADAELKATLDRLDSIRRGQSIDVVQIRVTHSKRPSTHGQSKESAMPTKTIPSTKYFESERTFPDPRARAWYDRLVGLDDQKRELLLELELLLFPDRLTAWSRTQHGSQLQVCQIMASRAPLLLLEGDVGCGKTVLAETVGDVLAERTGTPVHLLKVNTQVRGTGMVGEMTELIVQAFTHAENYSESVYGEPVLMLIDEADALAAKRTDQHMHHEDKAGLNTLLQRIDGLRMNHRSIAVMFITNRPDALDPAVRRRAAARLTFRRPNDQVRAELFRRSLEELNLLPSTIAELVSLTGKRAHQKTNATFTASDITDRLIPAALREAYAGNRPLVADDLIRHARTMLPTPLMTDLDNDG